MPTFASFGPAEIGGLRLTLLRVGGGIMIGLVGVIAAILVSPVGS
jgi:hypothetical protein